MEDTLFHLNFQHTRKPIINMQLLSPLDEKTCLIVRYIRAKVAVTWFVQVASRGQESWLVASQGLCFMCISCFPSCQPCGKGKLYMWRPKVSTLFVSVASQDVNPEVKVNYICGGPRSVLNTCRAETWPNRPNIPGREPTAQRGTARPTARPHAHKYGDITQRLSFDVSTTTYTWIVWHFVICFVGYVSNFKV